MAQANVPLGTMTNLGNGTYSFQITIASIAGVNFKAIWLGHRPRRDRGSIERPCSQPIPRTRVPHWPAYAAPKLNLPEEIAPIERGAVIVNRCISCSWGMREQIQAAGLRLPASEAVSKNPANSDAR